MKHIYELICIGVLVSVLSVGCNFFKLEQEYNQDTIMLDSTSDNREALKEDVVGKASEESLKEKILSISQYDRSLDSSVKKEAIEYIINSMQDLGYESYPQYFPIYYQESYLEDPDFDASIGQGTNIISEHTNNKSSNKTLYLTAHYDNTPSNTSGVIDNATGVTVLMELADILQHYNKELNIIFVFLDSEEYYLQGSKWFAQNLSSIEKEDILGVINVDMVGEIGAGDIAMRFGSAEHNIISLMWEHILDKGIKIDVGIMTDEVSFKTVGIPAITLENINPRLSISKETDQLQYLDYTQLASITDDISKFIDEFDIDYYNQLLNNEIELKSNWESLNKLYYIENANMLSTKLKLSENGAINEGIFSYKTTTGKTFEISTIPGIFWINSDNLKFKSIVNSNFSDPVMYYYINKIESEELTLTYYNKIYYGKLHGNISENEAIDILSSFHQSTCFNEYITP